MLLHLGFNGVKALGRGHTHFFFTFFTFFSLDPKKNLAWSRHIFCFIRCLWCLNVQLMLLERLSVIRTFECYWNVFSLFFTHEKIFQSQNFFHFLIQTPKVQFSLFFHFGRKWGVVSGGPQRGSQSC